jgi:hypothetical protein
MKKIMHILILGAFLAGCSGLPNIQQLLATPTPPPPPTETATPAATETPIPTQNLFATSTPTPLTFTPTVTSIGAELFTPTITATSILLATSTPGLPLINDAYFTPQDSGFVTILYSGTAIYWNEGPCWPRNIKISAFVADLINTHRVMLFMRLREKKNTLNFTEWGGGAVMVKGDNGAFNYNVRTWNIDDYWKFKDAWLEYQLVAYDKDMKEIGRSKIYDRNLTLSRCMPVR